MQYGAMNFPVRPILEEIEIISRLGFDYLELAMDPPMAHHSIVASNKAAISRALKDSGLGLVCHLPTFVTTADLTASLRQASFTEMLRSLDVAAEMGVKKVVLHPSMVIGMGSFILETVKGHFFDFLSEMVTVSQHLKISICLENMFSRNLLGVEPEDFEEIFRLFPSVKLTLDTGHANIHDHQKSRLQKFVQLHGARIGHLHFSDNHGRRDDHLAIGEGSVNFDELVRSLQGVGYDDTLTLEVFDANRNMLVDSREQIKAMLENR